MKLTDFDKKPVETAQRALKEHYGRTIDVNRMSYAQVRNMLSKVRGLMSESKASSDYYKDNSAYMKLVFMEQALSKHFATLSANRPRIVVENEEVEKSQVILAAQEMVDSIQKMVEQVSDMLVKELPAVVDGVNSEVGTDQGEQFNTQASESLAALQGALTQAKAGIQGALGVITGQGGMSMPGAEAPAMGTEPGMGDEMGGDMDLSADLGDEESMDLEMPEEPDEELGNVGRATR